MIYFAHAMADYGTPRARAALALIRRAFAGERVRDPERLDWPGLERAHGRAGAYAAAVGRCRAVVALGVAGAGDRASWRILARGTATECELALARCRPVFILKCVTGSKRQILPVRKISHLSGSDSTWERWAVAVTAPARALAFSAARGGGGGLNSGLRPPALPPPPLCES